MSSIRQKLIDKIKVDTGFEIDPSWTFQRPTLTWAHKSAGRMAWFWYTPNGVCVGSTEKMKDLLSCEKIEMSKSNLGSFIEFHSS